MKVFKTIFIIVISLILYNGCSPIDENTIQHQPTSKPPIENTINELPAEPDGKGVIHFTVMIHLEGWNDGVSEDKFEKHADIVRKYADIFEKYGAVMTLESREFTTGCINWNDNVLKEMEDRGHAIGLHADQGGGKKQSYQDFYEEVRKMKHELESLDVTVRHVSGVCSDKDWVTVCVDNGFEAVTGTVSYALWSLDEQNRPRGFVPYKTP